MENEWCVTEIRLTVRLATGKQPYLKLIAVLRKELTVSMGNELDEYESFPR